VRNKILIIKNQFIFEYSEKRREINNPVTGLGLKPVEQRELPIRMEAVFLTTFIGPEPFLFHFKEEGFHMKHAAQQT